jgi:heme/copper-type cytochrome/quinol oxidase subunit 4
LKKFPSVQSIFILSGVLAGSGFLGLVILIFATLPTLGPRWLFFFFLTLLAIGVSLPLIHFLHRRFPSEPLVNTGILLRQAIWVGVYVDLLVWLQLGRALDTARAVFIAIGLIVIEFLLRMRERSEFQPPKPTNE